MKEETTLKIREKHDLQYDSDVEYAKAEIARLTSERKKEINRVTNKRWETIVNKKFEINYIEGKIKINQVDVLFSSIKGAELNIKQGYREETIEYSKSKKKASIGNTLVGGALFGPVGAVVGGVAFGKTQADKQIISNQIPTCIHLGVLVNIDGFISEIVLLKNQVDQSSSTFTDAYNLAQRIVIQLGMLAKTPVPNAYMKPEDEVSVKKIEEKILWQQKKLHELISNKSICELTSADYIEEQKHVRDKDKFSFPKENTADIQIETYEEEDTDVQIETYEEEDTDVQIETYEEEDTDVQIETYEEEDTDVQIETYEEEDTGVQTEIYEEEDTSVQGDIFEDENTSFSIEICEENKVIEERDRNQNETTVLKRVSTILADIVFWTGSLFMALFAIAGFSTAGGEKSGSIFLLTAIFINPIVYKTISNKIYPVKRWVCIMFLLVGFITGIFTYPTGNSTEGDVNSQVESAVVIEENSSTKMSDMVQQFIEIGYTVEHAKQIESVLNTCGITSIEVYGQTGSGEAENGLNCVVCYPNGSKKEESRFFVTTEDGIPFYVEYRGTTLYDANHGGFLMKYSDVRVP